MLYGPLQRESQKEVLGSAKGRAWAKEDDQLWDITMDEVKDGNLRGPWSAEELEHRVGSLWVAARRFSIIQNDKVRPIDDFSEFLVNAAFGVQEKISLKGVEQVAAWARAWLGAVGDDRSVQFTDTSGRQWSGTLHAEWSIRTWRKIVGRVADLKSAYKQLPRHPAHACFSVVAVRHRAGGVKLFEALSLMFGATSAVYAFLRFSRALAALAVRLFGLIVVEFFDDFTQLEASCLAGSALTVMEGLFELLGWTVATTAEKRKPFDAQFVSLGVLFCMREAVQGWISLRNKPGRVEAIQKQATDLEHGAAGAWLQGCSFVEGQVCIR